MRRYFLQILLLLLMLAMLAGCSFSNNSASKRALVVYSTLEPKLTEELVKAYNEKNKKSQNFQPVRAVYEMPEKEPLPDMILAPTLYLARLKQSNMLVPLNCSASNILPYDFKDVDGYWTGVFYDPLVFVINQNFARRVGQKNLQSWNDIENLLDVRFTMESLNNSEGTMNLLAAMAGHMGEQSAINYMWNTGRHIIKYTKFPFSSIRMVATGEADMTVTVQSMVSKYLEIEFPAYTVMPKEGSPATMYGLAAFKGSESTYGNQTFMNWLLTDDSVKVICQKMDAGFIFLVHGAQMNPVAEPRKVWLNRDYLTKEKLEALTNQWLEKVRFSN